MKDTSPVILDDDGDRDCYDCDGDGDGHEGDDVTYGDYGSGYKMRPRSATVCSFTVCLTVGKPLPDRGSFTNPSTYKRGKDQS